MKYLNSDISQFFAILAVFLLITAITAQYSFLLFHIVAELFSIIIAFVIVIIVWNAKDKIDNGFILFIGISFFFIGTLDLIHTLAYKGMNIFIGYDANLPTQLWIATRYLQAFSFLVAPIFLKRRVKIARTFLGFSVITLLLLYLVFSGVFPDCFIEGSGLTQFKIISEYVICCILIIAIYLLYLNKSSFSSGIVSYLYVALVFTILSELAFTSYVSVYGSANFAGHLLKIIAFAFVYKAIIVTAIKEPYEMIFCDLSQNEKKFRELFENMNEGVVIYEMIENAGIFVDYLLIDCNTRFSKMVGKPTNEFIGKLGRELYRSPNPPFLKTYANVVRNGISTTFIAYYEPELKYYTISAYHLENNRFASVISDITAMKISEGALIRANNKLSLLTQITRHDINNDLSMAFASLSLLRDLPVDDPRRIEYLDTLEQSMQHINEKMNFTRNYEELGSNKPSWQKISDIISYLSTANNRSSSLTINNNLGDIEIFSDMMLTKVFENLIDNSLRHGKKVTTISLSYETTENGLKIIYADDGDGIQPEMRDNLFKPGYGTTHGYGLFLIKEILLLTGITITEEGERGAGVKFVLNVLPGGFRINNENSG